VGKANVICDVLLMTLGTFSFIEISFSPQEKTRACMKSDPNKVEALQSRFTRSLQWASGNSNETSTGFLSANTEGSATDVYNQVLDFN
jgi:hypothetical protein